jgi:GAF domain-containing protein
MLATHLRDEPGRLAALRSYGVLDTEPDPAFDHVTFVLRAMLQAPIATVTLVDEDRQWFLSRRGLVETEMPRDVSICHYTIQGTEPLVISDTRLDARFRHWPIVAGPPFITSYIGVPLRTHEGYNIGALCVMDRVRRVFEPSQIEIVTGFAARVIDELETRRAGRAVA